MRLAAGRRDQAGRWHADNPADYPPLDVRGTLPWSVLRQDRADWRARVAWWREQGVDEPKPQAITPAMVNTGRHGRSSGGVSRFDPHLAEVITRWYCPPGGIVMDPFAGGPVRSLVAAHLGYPYRGIELRGDQVEANRARAATWRERGLLAATPVWHVGAAQELLPELDDGEADLIFTCPPYHNRERYTTNPRDLSAMRWPQFLDTYTTILAEATRVLADDRLAVIVISDIRDSGGHMRGLPALTTAAMAAAGACLINEHVLVEHPGLRVKTMRPAWTAARTAMRCHQLVHVYVKGDRRKAAHAIQGGKAAGGC